MINEPDNQEFEDILSRDYPSLPIETIQRLSRFRQLVLQENERQNLTRLLSPRDFADGHVRDAIELNKSGFLASPAMDLGSGMGAPGLICAILAEAPMKWVLVESEKRKAEFLEVARAELKMSDVRVEARRAEEVLRKQQAGVIVARAVGPIERIFAWIHECSTWNTLILLKGPGWEKEWADFNAGRYKNRLVAERLVRYEVGDPVKSRVIISLKRK